MKKFLEEKNLIETLGFIHIEVQDQIVDMKRLMESVQFSPSIKKLTLEGFTFDQEAHGKSISRMLSESKTLKELEIIDCYFGYI